MINMNLKIILIMGLPGAGKTTLADALAKKIKAKRLNADEVRRKANDWDFSEEGRKRQAKRMSDFALKLKNEGNNVIADLYVLLLRHVNCFLLTI